jgi:hypothetical protein
MEQDKKDKKDRKISYTVPRLKVIDAIKRSEGIECLPGSGIPI